MIDVERETTIRLIDARKLTWLKGRGGQRLSLDSLRRWSLKGLRGVVLETVRLGGTTFTSVEAIRRFLERLNAFPATSRPSTERRREIEAANRRLDEAGIV